MPMPHSKILDLLEADPVDVGTARPDAVNAENAVIPREGRITAFRSFSASTRARESDAGGNNFLTTVTETENIVVTSRNVTCFSCWGSDFWQGSGAVVCRRCHPPAPGAEVLTLSRTGSDASGPVQIEAGSSALTPDTRTHGVRGGAA